jgi:hypothetical protein
MRILPKYLPVLAAAGAVVATITPAAAPAATMTCPFALSTTVVVTAPTTRTTSSTTPVNLTGATLTRNFSNPGCVIVKFSTQVKAPPPKAARVTLAVTGTPARTASPAAVDFTTAGTGFDGREISFFFPALEGNYQLQIKFQSVDGTPVSLNSSMMTVMYNNDDM